VFGRLLFSFRLVLLTNFTICVRKGGGSSPAKRHRPGAREAAEILLNGKYATMRKSRRPPLPTGRVAATMTGEIQHVSNKMRPLDGLGRVAQISPERFKIYTLHF
jgi:hypothetical protein